MRSSDICPAPVEPDREYVARMLTDGYLFQADEYPVAYFFRDILATVRMPYLDYSDYIYDDFTFHDGIIKSCWTIIFTARPDDAARLQAIARRLPYGGGRVVSEIPFRYDHKEV